jgi:hypothetical protein
MPEKLFGAKPKPAAATPETEPVAAVVKAVAAVARAAPPARAAGRDPWMQARPEKHRTRKRWIGKRPGGFLRGER